MIILLYGSELDFIGRIITINQEASSSPYLNLSKSNINFPYEGGSQTFTISTNTTSQSISYTGCVSSATRSGNTVTVTCAANNTTSVKTGTITVSGDGISKSVNITQAAMEVPYITLSPVSLNFPASGGTQTFTISTNTSSQTITYSGCVSSATRSGNTVTVTCSANNTTSTKTGTVTVTGDGISSGVSVGQAAMEAPYITLSTGSLSFPASGGTQTFTISTNTSSQTITYSGCVSSATRSGNTVTVTCSANSTTSTKTGTVTVTGDGISSSVSVSQAAMESSYITLSSTSLSFPSSGGSQTFTINTNTSGQTITYTGCVTSATKSGNTFIVTCGANSTYSSRSGTVTVSGGGVSSAVNITQGALPGSPAVSRNYIKTETVLEKGIKSDTDLGALDYDRKRTRVEYYDGLGRLSQVNDYRASASGTMDLIIPVIYDAYGRQAKDYLPFSSEQNMGWHTGATSTSNWTGHYGSADDDYACSEKLYDNSPLNRVMEQSAPGNTWRLGSGHTLKYDYGTNSASDVIIFVIDNSTGLLVLRANVYYPANSLYKTTTWDENTTIKSSTTNRTEEFKDKQERVVLKRSYIGTTAFPTYYVYNDKGLLCCVIPPKAVADGTVSSTELEQLCYQYRYDERNRLMEKKLPGAGWEYLIYDKRDRLVLSQDGNLRESDPDQYHYTLYDSFNRPVEQGIITDGTDYATLRAAIKNSSNYTPGTREAQVYTWYDNYDFRSGWGGPADMNTFVSVYPAHSMTNKVKGLVTGSRTKVLGSSPEKWICTENYYDKYGRLLQRYQGNPEDGYNRETYAYNFEGQVTDKQTLHKKTVSETGVTVYEKYTYDHMGRQTRTEFGYNTTSLTTLAVNEYDDLGRLVSKRQHNGRQHSDYAYNIRGWLTGVNDPAVAKTSDRLFAMKLFYDTDMSASLTGVPQYNGNISGMMWRRSDDRMRGYNFSYDGLNRLTVADYGDYSSGSWSQGNANDFSITTYDPNGNINGLSRNDSQGSLRDNLVYAYTGNQLTSVSGTVNGTGDQSGSFTYDANGNAKSDGLRGLTTISYYREINLPKQYKKDDNNKVDYRYDASGIKWDKISTKDHDSNPTTPSQVTSTGYYGPFIYQNGSLSMILTPEGYYDKSSELYHYYLKDHLGNTRITYFYSGATPIVAQEVEYDPFGYMLTDNIIGNNKYLYNGKELNDEFFENYDYGARFYDPQLGRFHTQDRFSEKYYSLSNYSYCANNPLLYIDVDGDSIQVTADAILAIYHALDKNANVKFDVKNGTIDPNSFKEQAENSNDIVLKDLYEIASNEQMVDLSVSGNETYKDQEGNIQSNEFETPYDFNINDLGPEVSQQLKARGESEGRTIQGNLGSTLLPGNVSLSGKRSLNGNIQVIINAKGSLNHRAVGVAHEFGHVVLYLRGLPHGHGQPGVDKAIYNQRSNVVKKRLGYDY